MGNKKGTRMEITEEKKRRAVHLKNQGWLNRDVARDTGILESTVANCWKRWAQELGMEIITRQDLDKRDYELMPVTVSYVEPLPPIKKEAEPVRPEAPSVLSSMIKSVRAEAAAAEESSEAEVIGVDPQGAFKVTAVEAEVREIPEDEAVQEEKAEAKAAAKKDAAPGRRMKRLDKLAPPAGRKAPEPGKTTELQRIYGLIGLINEAVVDYAIEMMVLPEQIGQSLELSDGAMTMVLSVPVGGANG